MQKIYLILIFLLGIIFTPLALAGGQLVSLNADVNGFVDGNIYGRIMRVYLHPEFPCKGTEMTFRFIEPKDGDQITTGAGGATYVMQEDRGSNGCGTYAKVYSKVYGERMFTVDVKNGDYIWKDSPVIKVHFDGQYHGDNHYENYSYSSKTGDPYSFIPSTPAPAPAEEKVDNTIYLWVLNQQTSDSGIRQALVKWGAFGGRPATSKILGSPDKNNWEVLLEGQRGPSATVNVKTTGDYYIKVNGCVDKIGTCVDSNTIQLPKYLNKDKVVIPQSPYPGSSPVNVIKPPDNSEKLNQRIASLEAKLAESQKKQSFLEQRINDLISFIKNLFPFFK